MTSPPPGSPAAAGLGCICDPFDNGFGVEPPRPPDGWWIDTACPLHSGVSSKRPEPPRVEQDVLPNALRPKRKHKPRKTTRWEQG